MALSFGSIQSSMLNRNLMTNTRRLGTSLERLSTGYRINRASDDAAGLSISETLITQIRGYEQSIRNAQDGYSMLSVAEGATSTISENLQRIRELTVQAGNDTLGSSERDAINAEINQRLEDIDRISESTQFSGVQLLSENAPANFVLQIGPNATANDSLDVASALGDAGATALGLTVPGNVDLSDAAAATSFLTTVDSAISTLSSRRSTLGAFQNRIDSVIDNLSTAAMNVSAANSRIRDTDIATETSNYVRYSLLQQFDVSLMAQVNNNMASISLGLINSLNR
ncbi:MAG: flagellin [Cyanobacteriota bacterium]